MTRFSDDEKNLAFFYAEQDAAAYDDIVEHTQCLYWQLHDTIIQLLRYHFSRSHADLTSSSPCTILDIGCGTGSEGIRILEAFPSSHILGLDFSQPMLDQFRNKLRKRYGSEGWQARCTLLCADILAEEPLSTRWLESTYQSTTLGRIAAVVTVFALHHYGPDEKLRVYKQLFDLLPPGGLFLNGDLFSYESRIMAENAQTDEELWISHQFSRLDPKFEAALVKTGRTSEEMQAIWIEHLRKYNVPLTIEEGWSLSQSASQPNGTIGEVRLLRAAGFQDIACPYRYFQSGILWARKG